MHKATNYLLVALLSCLLIVAQTLWASFIKVNKPFYGSYVQIAGRFVTSPKVWIGGMLYVLATAVYFVMLSKYKFFAIQIVMTALAVLFSTAIAYLVFHEEISGLNILGMLIIIAGIILVFK